MPLSDLTCVFNVDTHGATLTLSQLAALYHFEADGTNDYFHLADDTMATFLHDPSKAMPKNHVDLWQSVVDDLAASSRPRKLILASLEPTQHPPPGVPPDPYGHVKTPKVQQFVSLLATEMALFQDAACKKGKTLDIVIRYASEMNVVDPDNIYSQDTDPTHYQNTYALVRNLFRQAAPAIRFAFSPALRTGVPIQALQSWWPGNADIDVLGGTWYVGQNEDLSGASSCLHDYHAAFQGKNKPFALDEVGGNTASTDKLHGQGQDEMLQKMFDAISNDGMHLAYRTLFMRDKWGNPTADATLAFLQGPTIAKI